MGHESLHRDEALHLPPNRSFGLGCAAVCLIVGLLPLYSGAPVRVWALGVACAVAAIALVAPAAFAPLNRAWMRFGFLLNRIVNPIVLGAMFFVIVLPTGIVLRLVRGSSLREGYDAGARSYWRERTPPGPKPESLERQF